VDVAFYVGYRFALFPNAGPFKTQEEAPRSIRRP
jgi:hypothetical protein